MLLWLLFLFQGVLAALVLLWVVLCSSFLILNLLLRHGIALHAQRGSPPEVLAELRARRRLLVEILGPHFHLSWHLRPSISSCQLFMTMKQSRSPAR